MAERPVAAAPKTSCLSPVSPVSLFFRKNSCLSLFFPFTICPDKPTVCPRVQTSCPVLPTKCQASFSVTVCPDNSGGTWTVCPSIQTRCPLGPICIAKPADIDTSGKVNVLDLIKIRNNINVDPNKNGIFGDVNGDGRINVLDLILARNQMGQ